MIGFPKRVHFRSKAYLEYVRSFPCAFCGAEGRTHAHHVEIKGMGGGEIDDSTAIPVCPWCHQRCHGIVVRQDGVQLAAFSKDQQQSVAFRMLCDFLFRAPRVLLDDFADAVNAHRDRRGLL